MIKDIVIEICDITGKNNNSLVLYYAYKTSSPKHGNNEPSETLGTAEQELLLLIHGKQMAPWWATAELLTQDIILFQCARTVLSTVLKQELAIQFCITVHFAILNSFKFVPIEQR